MNSARRSASTPSSAGAGTRAARLAAALLVLVCVGSVLLVLGWCRVDDSPSHAIEPPTPPALGARASAPRESPAPNDERASIAPFTTRIDGVVLDMDGAAVGQARVCATVLGRIVDPVPGMDTSCAASTRDGTFSVSVAGHGRAALVAYGPDLVATAWGRQPRFPVVRLTGRAIEGVVLRVRGDGVTVRGTVVDRFGGPVAGATVVAGSGTRAGRPIGEHVVTDDSGRFSLAVDPAIERVIGAFATGYAAGGARVVPAEGAEVEIVLDPEGRLDGVVVDAETGTPVTGLRITAPQAPVPVFAISDARGRFSLRGLPAGEYAPEASGEGRFGRASAPVALDAAASADVRIETRPAGRILVETEDDVAPCELPRFEAVQGAALTSIVASPPEVTLHVTQPGTWQVSMSCDSTRSNVATIEVALGADTTATLHWPDVGGATVAGRVLRNGRGLGGERVRVWRDEAVLQTVTSGDGGRFVSSSVPPGRYVLTAGAVDRRAASAIGLEVADADVDGVELVSPPAATARVRVVQRGGAPCPNAQVRVRGALISPACQTDDRGACRMIGLEPGPAEFFVPIESELEAPTNTAEALVTVVTELVGGAAADVVLRLPEDRGALGGTVVRDGAPVPGARIMLRREVADDEVPRTTPRAVGLTDADGRFHVGGLPPGRWTLRAVGPTGASATLRGVAAGETHDITLSTDEG